jgi:O-antigen/teichoic acid export membrane protein
MSTAHIVGKGVTWNFFSTLVVKVLVLINVLVILTHLSVYEYGLSELVFSALSTVGIILLPGLTATIVADLGVERARKDYGRMKSLFHQYFLFLTVLSFTAFLIFFFGATIIAELSGNVSLEHFLRIVSFSFLVAPFRAVTLLMANVHIRFVDQAVYPLVEESTKLLVLLFCFFYLHLGLEGLLYAYVLCDAFATLVFIPRTLSGYALFKDAVSEGGKRFWELLSGHRKWSIASSYVGTLSQNMQLWIIKFTLGTEAVGLYAFASGIYSNVSSLLPFTNVLASLTPKYVDKRDQLVRLIATSSKAQFYLALIFITGAMVLLPVLVWFLPKYLPALPLTICMLLVLLPTSVVSIFTPIFATLKRQFEFFKTMTVKLALTAVILPVMILVFGVIGIGVATVLVNILSGVERYIRLRGFLPEYRLSVGNFLKVSPAERSMLRELIEGLALVKRLRGLIPGQASSTAP